MPSAEALASIEELIRLRDERLEAADPCPYYPRGSILLRQSSLVKHLQDFLPCPSPSRLYIEIADEEFLFGASQLDVALMHLTSHGLSRISVVALSSSTSLRQKLTRFKSDLDRRATLEAGFFDCHRQDFPPASGVRGRARYLARFLPLRKVDSFVIGENPQCLWLENRYQRDIFKGVACAYLNPETCRKNPDYQICWDNLQTLLPHLTPLPLG